MFSELLHAAGNYRAARDRLWAWMARKAPVSLWTAGHELFAMARLAGIWDGMPDGPLGFAAADDPLSLPYPEASRWWRERRVVTAPELRQLDEDARFEAFSVAGVTDQRVIQGMHDAMARAIDEGTGFFDFVDQVDELVEQEGAQPFDLHHLSTVFDTNVANAYAAGRYQQLMRVRRTRPIWTYHAIDDGRAREPHRRMDAHRARWDAPVWAVWHPPNGFRCRCSLTAETEDEARAAGWSPDDEPPDVLPDRGFSASPAMDAEVRATGSRAAGVVRDHGLLESPAVDRERYQSATSEQQRAALYQRGLVSMGRDRDPARVAQLREAAQLDDDDLVDALTTAVRVERTRDVAAPTETLSAQLCVPSQHALSVRTVLRRWLSEPSLTGLRADVDLGSRVSVGRLPAAADELLEVALDPSLQETVGDAAAMGWGSDLVLQVPLQSASQARRLASWVQQEYRRGEVGAIGTAPPIPDLRVMGVGSELLNEGALRVAYRNTRGDLTALSLEPLDGWEHQVIAIGADLAETLGGTT